MHPRFSGYVLQSPDPGWWASAQTRVLRAHLCTTANLPRECLWGPRGASWETSQVLESVQGSQGLKYMISAIALPHLLTPESHRRAAAPSQVFTSTA